MQFTRTALDEIESILDGALLYGGAPHARKVRRRIERLFDHLDRGVVLGTPRPDMGLSDDFRFIPTTPYPFIVIYDKSQKLVLRVVYARSNYRELTISDWFPA